MKKKMAFVDLSNFDNWPVGGMLEYEKMLLNYLYNYFEIDIWGVTVDGGVNKEININGVKYPINVWGNVKTYKKMIPNYWRGLSIRKIKDIFPKNYDYVYVHTGSCAVALNRMIDHSRTKLIYHQHGLSHLHDYALKSLIQRPFVNYAQKISDVVFVVSDKESVERYAETMKKKSKSKFVQVLSPIILENSTLQKVREKIEDNKLERTKTFIYTGRLDAHKDVKTVIEAFRLYYQKQDKDIRLIIVGDGEEKDKLFNKVKEYGLEKKIVFVGAVPHDRVKEYLMEADIYLTASIGEGISIAVLEAYEYGLPVVCFKVPGLEKQVVDNVSGIVARQHSVLGMYEAMLFADKNRTKLAKGCIDEVKKYDAKKLSEYIAKKILEE